LTGSGQLGWPGRPVQGGRVAQRQDANIIRVECEQNCSFSHEAGITRAARKLIRSPAPGWKELPLIGTLNSTERSHLDHQYLARFQAQCPLPPI
jgi:hypothetical protein